VTPAQQSGYSVVVVDDPADLATYREAWEHLAAAALEPNVFYEPWMLMPALDGFGRGKDLLFVLVFASRDQQPAVLCGLFPLERTRTYKGLPAGALRLWKYVHCFLCTPLVHAEHAAGCLEALFAWLRTDRRGSGILELDHIAGEGPFHQALVEHLRRQQATFFIVDSFARAFWRRADHAPVDVNGLLSSSRRKKIRRFEKALAGSGKLDYDQLEAGDDPSRWIEEFLSLEARGWKGRNGTALACCGEDRIFFESVAREAHRRGRLMMLALRVDGEPIAHLNNFQGGAGMFAFKTAFAEEHGRHSPGMLLEAKNLCRVAQRSDVAWLDSCTALGPSALEHLLPDRRTIRTIAVATGRDWGSFILSTLPALRWLKRKITFSSGAPAAPSCSPPPAFHDSSPSSS
jgi:CelD/BcsL family acetyltransferase involved in cellulose biosynthesis